MSSNAIKIIAAVLVVLAVILVGFAYHLSRKYAEQSRLAQRSPTPAAGAIQAKAQIVVATRALAANQPITSDEVAVVPVQVTPPQYFTKVDQVINRVPMIDIDAGTPIVPRFFRPISILARDIPPGDRAVSIAVNDVIGTGGWIKPGDTVDVLLYLRGNPTDRVQTQARLLLRNAKVLAYEDQLIEPPPDLKKKNQPNQAPRHQRTAVLAVPEKDTTRVMLGASLGEVRLALHPAGAPASASSEASNGSVAGAVDFAEVTAHPVNPTLARILAQQPITAAELAQLAPPKPLHPLPPKVVIYRGDKVVAVRP